MEAGGEVYLFVLIGVKWSEKTEQTDKLQNTN